MKDIILITGAGSMVARKLTQHLENRYSIRYLSRYPANPNEFKWDISNKYIDSDAFIGVKHVIHLAGATISKRWTKKWKEAIVSSRVEGAQLILAELQKRNQIIDSYISASAVGYYEKQTLDVMLTEESPPGKSFLSTTCQKWEQSAMAFKANLVARNVSILRLGVVLSDKGGFLQKIMPSIKFGLGSAVGTGKQFVPWIHIDDLCRMMQFLLEDELDSGTYNAVSPQNITNAALIDAIAESLKRKIFIPNIPGFVVKLIFGEMATVLLDGNKVSADKIKQKGFVFQFENIKDALSDLFPGNSKG